MEGATCDLIKGCERYLTCKEGTCIHDGLFPMDFLQVVAYFIIPFIVGLANVGGVGGGIVKVPILVLILNYDTSQSTSIAYPITLGGCLANIFLLLREKHPTQDKPLIDFGIAIILVPAILIGTNTGVLMNNTMPEIFLNGFFILFLCFVCPYLMKRGITMLKLEQQVRKEFLALKQEMRQESVVDDNINVVEMEKELIEEDHGASGRFSQIDDKPKLERFKTIVQEYRKTVAEDNSYFFNQEEFKFHRQQSMYRQSSIRAASKSLNYSDFASKLAKAQENAQKQEQEDQKKKNTQNNNDKKEPAKQNNVDIELQDVTAEKNDVNVVNEEKDNQEIEKKTDISVTNINDESIQDINEGEKSRAESLTIPTVQNEDEVKIREQILEKEKKAVPLNKILFLIGCLSVVTFFAFVLGKKSIFGFKKCDAGYWIFFVLQYGCLVALSFLAFTIMKKEIAEKHKCKYEFDENDLQKLEVPQYLKISGAGSMAGFIAGMLGAGAGLVIVPVLLILNVNSRVASATSGFMYFFIAWASILKVITGGQLGMDIIGWYIGLALIGGGLVSPLVYWMVNKYKRNSFVLFIVFGIAFINIISCILYIIKSNNLNGFAYLAKFKNYCE